MIVTEKAKRPALPDDNRCFYCHQKIGELHTQDCTLLKKMVRVQMTVEFEIEVPSSWDADTVAFHFNRGAWCADNVVEELQRYIDRDDTSCLCSASTIAYLHDASLEYLSEE